jgi:hypothetical protein
MLRILVDALQRPGQPRLIAQSDDGVPPTHTMVGGDYWAAVFNSNGRQTGPSSIEVGVIGSRWGRTPLGSEAGAAPPNRGPGTPLIEDGDIATRVLEVLAEAEGGASLWVVDERQTPAGPRAIVATGAQQDWRLRFFVTSGGQVQSWSVDGAVLAAAWRKERATCAALASEVPPEGFEIVASGRLGDVPTERRQSVRRSADDTLVRWIVAGGERPAGCSHPWGFVLRHGSRESQP